MKNIRNLLIGAVIGGALGSKMGAYLATMLEVQQLSYWVESGFIYGMLGGLLTVLAFLAGFIVSKFENSQEISGSWSLSEGSN